MFIEDGDKRYRRFYRQLNKLSLDDQLAAIYYIIFAYTENVFLNPTTQETLKTNENFLNICALSTTYSSLTPILFNSPIDTAINEFSLSNRHKIPNLLNIKYALNN